MGTRVRSKVVKKDAPSLRAFTRALKSMGHGGAHVRVGLLAGDGGRAEGPNNASIAAVHEYGYPEGNIPERPFMGPSFDKHAARYEELLLAQAKAFLEGRRDLETALGLIGLKMVADVREYIVGGAPIPPPNSPAVLERKAGLGGGTVDSAGRLRDATGRFISGGLGGGTVRTLVDTGQMVGAIIHDVSTGKRPTEG